jgi:transcriptional regulator with XRE-family HTH domain
MMDFSEWLVDELERRGWSRSEAARRGNISPSMFDKVINGYAKPGTKFLDGIAQAFDLSQIVVYRKAGLLPQGGNDQVKFEDWKFLLDQLTPEEEEEMRQIAIMKIERHKKNGALKSLKPKRAGK